MKFTFVAREPKDLVWNEGPLPNPEAFEQFATVIACTGKAYGFHTLYVYRYKNHAGPVEWVNDEGLPFENLDEVTHWSWIVR